MWRHFLPLVLLWTAADSTTENITDLAIELMSKITNDLNYLDTSLDATLEKLENLEKGLVASIEQQMMLHFYVTETSRSSENSGVKATRNTRYGGQSFGSPTTADGSETNMHNHANLNNTPGLGEFAAVLNGVEFKTRHNDYKIVMKCRNNSTYKCTEAIEPPNIPPSVNGTVPEQIAEMRQYFKAWAEDNTSIRADYQNYFRPVLCYMEGMWTIPDNETIEESFASDRHALDASTWKRLYEKMRFLSYAGMKDPFENIAYLPSTIWGINNDSTPLIAQWNYHILCHPLKDYLPKDRLLLVDNLPVRIAKNLKYEKLLGNGTSRMARFRLAPVDASPGEYDGTTQYESTLLDELMAQIPGMDNYPANITDDLNDEARYQMKPTENILLNAGYFSRNWRTDTADANGKNLRYRGYADEYLFRALTTHLKIPGLTYEQCNKKGKNCVSWFQRSTYAIPLEIIYLTPLSKWNPYNIPDRGDADSAEGMVAHEGMDGSKVRHGSNDLNSALNGTNSKYFYRIPFEFFDGGADNDPADTNVNAKYVLDPSNSTNILKTSAGGIYISFPPIEGVNNDVPVRQRYFMAPFTFNKQPASKEVEALQTMVFNPEEFEKFYPNERVAVPSDFL